MIGNRGIYKDGWFAGRRFQLPWELAVKGRWEESLDKDPWELYRLSEDYSQAHDLAAQNPAKLQELVAVFDEEARRNNIYPVAPLRLPIPSPADNRTSFVYREGAGHIPARSFPIVNARSHTFIADVEVPAAGVEGVIYAEGGRYGGFSLYVKDGKLVYENNAFGVTHEKIVASNSLPQGKANIVLSYVAEKPAAQDNPIFGGPGGGRAQLSVNGHVVGETKFGHFGPFSESFDVGNDFSSPVSNDYVTPFPFTGKIDKVALELK
jgi:arylsulfatase